MKVTKSTYRCERVIALLVCISLVLASCAETPTTAQRFSLLREAEQSSRAALVTARGISLFSQRYDELFSRLQDRHALERIDSANLVFLFRAAHMTAFYSADPRHVADMTMDFAELERRGDATDAEAADMFEMLIAARDVDAAKDFATRHPKVLQEPLPDFHEASHLTEKAPTEWIVSNDRRELLRQTVGLDQPAEILVIGHPMCHFSQDAARDIQSDPVLHDMLRTHGKWLSPPDGKLNFTVFQQWNHEHPDQTMSIAYRMSEWPLVDYWGTPTFYFLREGKVVDKVTGWPKEGNREALIAGARKIGLQN